MSHEILVQDLRAKGEKKVQAIRQNAMEELEKVRAESREKFAGEENACLLKAKEHQDSLSRRLNLAARRKAAVTMTNAEQALIERCRSIALKLLPELRNNGHKKMFKELAAEIPAVDWQIIRVNPQDTVPAQKLFPEAEITEDESICGGLIAINNEKGITVDNTFSKRLERVWPELASKLLRELKSDE